MGGGLHAVSTPGNGSTFTLELVLPTAPEQAVAPALPLRMPTTHARPAYPLINGVERPLRVLIAEDNPINQQVAAKLVAQLGYQSDIVGNGIEAVDAVLRQRYDVVLMDIQMPELDGEQATRQIRALGGLIVQPYIIALTAFTLTHDRRQVLAAGMNDYLSKPIRLETLRNAFNQATVYIAPDGELTAEEQQTPLIDWSALTVLEECLAGDVESPITTILHLFTNELALQIDELIVIELSERERIAALAHRLRGGSKQLGAQRVAAWCGALERRAATADPELISRLEAQIQQSFAQTLQLVQEHYGVS
jgi:CheY-like chemotaxis protein